MIHNERLTDDLPVERIQGKDYGAGVRRYAFAAPFTAIDKEIPQTAQVATSEIPWNVERGDCNVDVQCRVPRSVASPAAGTNRLLAAVQDAACALCYEPCAKPPHDTSTLPSTRQQPPLFYKPSTSLVVAHAHVLSVSQRGLCYRHIITSLSSLGPSPRCGLADLNKGHTWWDLFARFTTTPPSACNSMDDGEASSSARPPPPPPEPRANGDQSLHDACLSKSDEPLNLASEEWDINAVSGKATLHMLIRAVQALADTTGDVPPTPPVSRPRTPVVPRRTSSPDAAHVMVIGSPEAHPHEPIALEVGEHAEDLELQRIAIARRFFSKVAPGVSLSDYLLRLHRFCPHSPGVYLAAAVYIHRLCVTDRIVPVTNRTIHRLSLASIRIAAKALEDNKWMQERMAGVGGVSRTQLMNLEITLCFLLDFDLGVDCASLAKGIFGLQQAAKQGGRARTLPQDNFKLRLPLKKKNHEVLAFS
nr:cyclin-u2-1 [Quercus suber]